MFYVMVVALDYLFFPPLQWTRHYIMSGWFFFKRGSDWACLGECFMSYILGVLVLFVLFCLDTMQWFIMLMQGAWFQVLTQILISIVQKKLLRFEWEGRGKRSLDSSAINLLMRLWGHVELVQHFFFFFSWRNVPSSMYSFCLGLVWITFDGH